MIVARRHAGAAALLLTAAMLGGCLDVPVPSASSTLAPTPEPTPVTITYQLDATVWYEGLVIYVDSAVATLDQRGGPVEVRLRLENPGDADSDLSARILLQVDGGARGTPPVAPTRESKVPTVPAHGIVGAVMTYELQGVPSVEKGVIRIGEAPSHVALIPLTAAGGARATFEPVAVAVSGRGDAADLRIALRSGELRWDLPDWSAEMAGDLEALTLTYDATYLGNFTGGFAFTGDNVALRLPDGKLVEARRDGHSQSIELIGAGSTKTGLFSRFEVPSGLTGRFALVVRSGSAKRAIAFTIEG